MGVAQVTAPLRVARRPSMGVARLGHRNGPRSGPRVLITGAAGFIGRNLWHELEGRGCDVVGVDDLSVAPRIPHRPETVLADVKTLTNKDLAHVDVIVHLAAHKSVADSFRDNYSVERNLGPAHHLIRLFLRSSARRLLLASTCEVYGSQSRTSIDEGASMRPRSPYAVSKSAIEQLAGVVPDPDLSA